MDNYPTLEGLIGGESVRSIDDNGCVTVSAPTINRTIVLDPLTANDLNMDTDDSVSLSDSDGYNSPRAPTPEPWIAAEKPPVPPPPRKVDRPKIGNTAVVAVIDAEMDGSEPPGYSSDSDEPGPSTSSSLGKSKKRNLRKKRAKAAKAAKATEVVKNTTAINQEVRGLNHELMIVLQRSATVIDKSCFWRSQDGRKVASLTRRLFTGRLGYASNQLLLGSKQKLKAYTKAEEKRQKYVPGPSK